MIVVLGNLSIDRVGNVICFVRVGSERNLDNSLVRI
jgi:hypothetical protein